MQRGILLKSCCGHGIRGLDLGMAELADKRQNVGADRIGEESNGFALAAVVDGEHVELEMA